MDAMNHYNHVTDAWKEFMGNNLHFGYFEHEGVELAEATDALIDKMMGLCNITEDTIILDVGCGIGNPAFYIHTRHRCKIVGISTSERGVNWPITSVRRRDTITWNSGSRTDVTTVSRITYSISYGLWNLRI